MRKLSLKSLQCNYSILNIDLKHLDGPGTRRGLPGGGRPPPAAAAPLDRKQGDEQEHHQGDGGQLEHRNGVQVISGDLILNHARLVTGLVQKYLHL